MEHNEQPDPDFYKSGFEKYHSKDYAGAIEDFNESIKLKSHMLDAYYWRAVTKYAMGDTTGSCSDYEKAKKLGHESAQDMLDKYCK